MSTEKIFANGFVFKRQDNAPDFVIGSLSCKSDEAIAFLKNHTKPDGWVNLSIKRSKAGKAYIELDTWEPRQQQSTEPQPVVGGEQEGFENDDPDDLPF